METQMSILNPHPQRLPGASLLHELVRNDVSDDTPALDYLDEQGGRHSTTYRKLHDDSDLLARHLYGLRQDQKNPRPERFIVPVFIGQCPELYMAQMAILKAGGAFCPITLDVPEDRLRFILADASATVLVTTSELSRRLPQLDDVSVVLADKFPQENLCDPVTVNIDPSMPAYVMYTSGSTGQPKGVVLSHSAATQALLAHDRHIPPFTRFLQFASPTFDVSVFEIFFPLFRGCTLVICERRRMLNDLPATINSLGVDAAELTPSVANSLLQGRQSVPKLKVLLTIGEMLKQTVVEEFGGSVDEPAVLHGMYGPTEATIHCTLQPDFAKDMPVNNIGVPLDTVSAFIVRPASDKHPSEMVEILPIGEEGELAVGGYQLADGYLNREEQTKAAFVSHPEHGQLYRTGDRAKLDSHGRLMCLGRISSGQVKLRGQRIELGEIEYAASRTSNCRDVVADVIKDTLVAFCVPSSPGLHESHIQDTCKKWLPPYMVPTDILILDSMPYLASGKVDRRTLQKLHQEFRESQDSHPAVEVRPELRQLAGLFQEVLNVDVIQLPNISAAGIDSLSSIRIASKLRENGYPNVSATDILEVRTLSELHDRLDTTPDLNSKKPSDVSLLQRDDMQSLLQSHKQLSQNMNRIQDCVACTPVQSAMLSETGRNPRSYCNWIELQVDLQRSIGDVQKAVQALIRHHEMLRTGFAVLNHAQHPYASIIWKDEYAADTSPVAEFHYDYAIQDEDQMLCPRTVQLRQSARGTSILFQLHHSLYDQWSVDIMKEDLDQLLQGNELSSPFSYTAVASYHLQNHAMSPSTARTEFWQSHLQQAAVTPLPQLNGQKCAPDLQRSNWQSLTTTTASLKQTAAETNTSAPAIFQAAYSFLLSLYAGTSDVLYGTVFSGRHVPVAGVERIFGPCLSTLPSRTDIDGVRTCRDLIQLVHNNNRAMLKFSDTPLVEVKKIGNFAPNETMFDTLFVWQESTFAKPQLVAEIDSADQHELNLVLEVEPRSEHVAVRVTYQQSRIDKVQVQTFVEQLQFIAQRLIDEPQLLVSDLAKSLPERMLAIDNPHPATHPHEEGLIAALEKVAERIPSAPALVFARSLGSSSEEIQSLTYREMHISANKLARHLIFRGVKADDLICVCMDKSIDLYVAILAVLKAGAGYLPLLPDTPKDRLRSILDQTSPRLFLCDDTVSGDARSVVEAEVVDLSVTDVSSNPGESLELPYCGAHAAYSIFTSGSTGIPKGLVVTQDNLLGNLSTLAKIYPVEAGSRLLQACSQAFDVSVFEIFFAFFTGMPLCFARKDDLFQDIERGIRSLGVTHLSLTPTVAALVDPDNVPSVRFLVTAGEPMTNFVHKKWAGRGLHQGYGPSETTNICTVNAQMPSSDIISNIGPTFPNTSTFVIDPHKPFQILPLGAVGEYAFGGEQVFRGYIGRDELNAEKIVDHPVYGRVYRSGDIGRMLPGGTLLISGRIDDQVKVRGNRIELGEINASMLQNASVEDCTTMVIGKDSNTQSIVTFWIPTTSPTERLEALSPTAQLKQQVLELFQRLENSLPPYMVPTMLIPMRRLPRTTQGKLDRRRLELIAASLDVESRQAYYRAAGQADEDDGEWTPVERELLAVLETVIDVPSSEIGRNTSFFALGLNSINAIAYAKAIEKRLGTVVSMGSILKNASIALLSSAVSSKETQRDEVTPDLSNVFSQATISSIESQLAIDSRHAEAILPCTPLQEAMLSAGNSHADATYSNRTKFKVTGDVEKLFECFHTLAKRHAILRTRFFETSQPNHPFAQVVLREVDDLWLEQAHGHEINGNAKDLKPVSPEHPFSLLVESSDRDDYLVLNMHHAIYDGTSMSLLLEEAEMLYNEQVLAPAPTFEPFLKEVQAHAGSTALDFWSSHVRGYSAKPFPLRSEADSRAMSGRIEIALSNTQSDIDGFAKRKNVSAASIYQTAWAKVLAAAQSADDFCFGDVVSGRSIPVANIDKLVAPCFNTLPIRISLDGIHDNIGLVQKLHRQRLAADSYQLTPLRRIQARSKTPSVHLFDSLLLVQPPAQDLNKNIWELREDEGLMDLPLVIEIVQNRTTPDVIVHYDGKYFSEATASMIANAFASSLEDCLRFPSSNIRDISGVDGQSLSGRMATKLVAEDSQRSSEDETSEEVWSDEERLLQQAFSHFSGVDAEKVRRHTSLYRLGLDSLHAVQVASRLRSKGLSIAAADVMEYQTPAALAAAIATAPESEDRPKLDLDKYDSERRSRLLGSLDIRPSALEGLRPCTPAQNGMISQSLESHGDLYVNHIVYEIPDGVTEDALRDAWRRVQHKHQALRMGFVQTEEGHCPFAMMIYNIDGVYLPFKRGSSKQAEVSADIVDTIHRPAWRVAIDHASGMARMTLSMHHALYDAESLQVLLSDLSLALLHKDIGTPLSIDNILDSMLMVANNVESQAEQFWRKSLEGSSPSPFPNLNSVTTAASDLYAIHKTSDLSFESLESLCKSRGCTIQAAGQTAWALLLSAYLGEPTVTFGTVFSGRTDFHKDAAVFPSIATLPVFCNTSKGGSETLKTMTDFNGSAQRHKYVPLSDLQRFANLPGQALFDTVFVYQKSNMKSSDSFTWQMLEQSAAVDYNVSLELETTTTTISLVLTANRGIVPEEHSRLILEQYDHLLKHILQDSTPSPFSHPDVYSNTPAKYPSLPSPVQLLHQFVEEGARNTPNRPALEFAWDLNSSTKSRKIWSYKELDDRSNQAAHMVQANGAEPGGIVAVCMNKCPEASFAFIGILKAGCAFLALDPELPQARKEFILKDSGAAVLLVDQVNDVKSDEMPSKVIILQESHLEDYSTSAIDAGQIDPQATCYCLYTSGTTGTPKGCELTHENAVQAMMAFQKLFAGRWNEYSRWLQFASYWFDVSVLEQFWSWSVGITLVGAPRDLVLDDIAMFIQQLQITHIDLTPSLARILDPEDVPSLWDGVFITGGEALKQEIIDKWGSHRTICNGYGPTEATIGVTMNPFVGPDAKSSNIGPAFLNVGSYVFEPGTTTPVLRGAIGELCVSGKLVGKGYLNRPELTAKAFPVLEATGEKIYLTGDLVRQAADGSFLFIGRQDSQAKLRGQRLEIDEIDAVVKSSTDSIADYASLVIKGNDKETLVTFFITEVRKQTADLLLDISEESRTAARLALESCRSRLPGYMVPTHILPVNIIPLTVNNKIDVKRLTAFYNELSVSALQSIKGKATTTKTLGTNGKKICEILERMSSIDVKAVDSDTNIFSLGLSSVSAITFTTLLKRAGFANANVAMIMRHPEIGQLTDALSDHAESSQDFSSVRQAQMSMEAFNQRYRTLAAKRLGLEFDEVELVAPCTPLQQGLILESFRGEEHPYFNEFTFDVSEIEISRLQSAFQQIHDLVQALRTKFIQTDDGYAQIVLQHQQIRWHHNTSVPAEMSSAQRKSRQEWLARNKTELFSPFEVVIIETPQATSLTIFIHHALYDGISFDMIMNKVSEAYHGQSIDCGPNFTEALPYGPLRLVKDADKFWETHLGAGSSKDLPQLTEDLPTEDPVEISALQGGAGLDDICRNLGVSHQAVLQACFAVALHEQAPDADFYGTVVSGRSFAFEHADKVLGPLFNTLPNPLLLQSDDTWASLVQKCQDFNVAALSYQHTPLRDIKKWCGREPSDPVFQAIFVFQNLQAAGTSSNSIWRPTHGPVKAEYPLAFELEYNARNELSATVVAKRNIATKATLRKLLTTFDSSLKTLCEEPSQQVTNHFRVIVASDKAASMANGIDKPTSHLNGVHDFKWTEQAKSVRSEIASLASLGEDEIDEHSSLFSLGLDSIDAVKLTSRLKRSGISISVSTLIRSQTIPRIISSIDHTITDVPVESTGSRLHKLEQQLSKCVALADSFDKTQVERITPATPSQEALISEMIRSDFHEYYNHDVLRLQHDIDLKRLANAWETVIHQSPILRTSFIEVSSPDVDVVYAQVVQAPQALEFTLVELSDISEVDSILENIRDEVKRSFSERPPIRLTFVTAASETYLVLSLAHAQYDGHSLALIHGDVQQEYATQSSSDRPLADSLIEASLAAVDDKALAFWRSNLSGARACRMPQANPDADADTLHRVEDVCSVTAEEARTFCRSSDFSVQALAQTVWALTLAHYTGRLDVIFGAVLACRDSEEAERVLFPLMNTIPVRATLHGTRREMTKHMQDINTDILPFQRTPLRHIQKISTSVTQSNDTNDSSALFDTLFVYQHRPESADQQEKILYESVGGSSNIEYPVAVEVEALGDRMVLRAACKHTVLDQNGAQELLQTYDRILSAIINTPNEPTVKFLDAKTSICGLSAIQIASGNLNEVAKAQKDEDVSEAAPSSVEATKITEALCQVSRTPPGELSASSTIESIGIDSISAIKVVALLKKQGVKLSVGELIRAKTVARMAKVVQDRESGSRSESNAQYTSTLVASYVKQHKLADVPSLHGIEADNVQDVLPALPGQTYMLNVWQATKGLLFYPTFTYSFSEHATEDQLRKAWEALVASHDILRTVFCLTGNTEVPIARVVLKQVPSTFISGNDERQDMPQQPMAQLRVIKSSTAWEVKLQIHHALYDASSLPLLMEDFESLLRDSSPIPSPVSQADFLALSLAPSAIASRQKFWKEYLSGVNIIHLQQPGSVQLSPRVEIFKPALLPITTSLEATARGEGLTLQSLLFASYAKIYAGVARQAHLDTAKDDVIIGIYVSGRSHAEHLPTLRSPTLNLVPLLVRSASTTPLVQSARQIQHDLEYINTPENSAVALHEIAAWTGVKVDTFVNFQRLPNAIGENGTDNQNTTNELQTVDDERLAARSHVVNADHGKDEDFKPAKELSSMTKHLTDAYLHSIDLEATITPSGTLDVGFFGPESMVGLRSAEHALEGLRQELEEL